MLTLPILFVSNALYPLASLPMWMWGCGQVNPMSYVVDGLRQTVFQSGATLGGTDLLPLWLCFSVVAAFGVSRMLVAHVTFKRSIK